MLSIIIAAYLTVGVFLIGRSLDMISDACQRERHGPTWQGIILLLFVLAWPLNILRWAIYPVPRPNYMLCSMDVFDRDFWQPAKPEDAARFREFIVEDPHTSIWAVARIVWASEPQYLDDRAL